MKNVMKKVAEGRRIAKISNYKYSLCHSELRQLMDNHTNLFDTIGDSFDAGYFQGYKAAKAEMKRKEVKAHESISK